MIIRRLAPSVSAHLFVLAMMVAFVAALIIGCGDDDKSTGPDTRVTVTDIDGNVYQTILIGNQRWMAENLKVTRYRNGDSIPNVIPLSDWDTLQTGARNLYGHDTANLADYGLLYNWYAVDDSRIIAPVGWHVPSDSEWMALEMYLGMSEADAGAQGWRGTDEGGKLKETDTVHWEITNVGATDEFGFGGRAGGMRHEDGSFLAFGSDAYFWSSTANGPNLGWFRSVSRNTTAIYRANVDWGYGFSVRCVKDAD